MTTRPQTRSSASSLPDWPSGHIGVPLMDVTLDRNGLAAGLLFAGALTVLVVIGSQGLRGFDGALAGYCFSALFAVFGIVYRYAVWLQRPATRLYWARGWQLFWQPGHRWHNTGLFFRLTWEKLLEQGFIRRRSRTRWLAHQLIFWGCALAILVTFPLTFGWIRFESVLENPANYVAVLFGIRLEFAPFAVRGLAGWIIFHLLDISAVLCLAGVALSVARRMRDEVEIVTQRVDNDFVPLVMLFAVSITGLMLTVSNMFMEGKFYYWITTTHAVTVMLWLLFLPFGKFFHIFQRVANLGVWFYKAAGAQIKQAECERCGSSFTSLMHRDDLKAILPELEFDYTLAKPLNPSLASERGEPSRGGASAARDSQRETHGNLDNWQNLCPSCRRKLVTLNQFRVAGKEFI